MSFSASMKCDACGCINEVDLECFDPADAEDAVFNVAAEYGWFVNPVENNHYCPEHAREAEEEFKSEKQPVRGIYPTMVG
ncbi:hypothetical protein ACP6H4_01990 [Vibrio harveyi]|uniref:hypothetical protein n=1 Tax=Vibrio harveyi TaxID=669 RepID=UPI003CF235B1